ncbi:MAG: hypothetical protein QW096_12825 [Thermofilaceae archaeon]
MISSACLLADLITAYLDLTHRAMHFLLEELLPEVFMPSFTEGSLRGVSKPDDGKTLKPKESVNLNLEGRGQSKLKTLKSTLDEIDIEIELNTFVDGTLLYGDDIISRNNFSKYLIDLRKAPSNIRGLLSLGISYLYNLKLYIRLNNNQSDYRELYIHAT